MKIMFGTTNEGKLSYMQGALAGLPVEIVRAPELDVEETGETPLENAEIKAMEYYKQFKEPVFAIDSGLYLDGFTPDKQPGVYVRRVNGKYLNDEEMIEHYSREIKNVGGKTTGKYQNGICLIMNGNNTYTDLVDEEWLFVSEPSDTKILGLPISSLQINPKYNKYRTEITEEEYEEMIEGMTKKYREFFERVIDDMEL